MSASAEKYNRILATATPPTMNHHRGFHSKKDKKDSFKSSSLQRHSTSPSDGMILTATGLTMDPSMMEEVLHRGGGETGGGVTAGHHAKYDYERHDNTQITFRMPHFQAEGTRELVEEEGVGGGGGGSNLVSVSGNRVIVNSNSGGSSEDDDANSDSLLVRPVVRTSTSPDRRRMHVYSEQIDLLQPHSHHPKALADRRESPPSDGSGRRRLIEEEDERSSGIVSEAENSKL